MERKIKAKIVSMEYGLQEYEEIEMIRVKGENHSLLILQNYMPLLGHLDGYVDLVLKDETLRIQDVKGYYMHKQNEFSLLVEDGDTKPVSFIEEGNQNAGQCFRSYYAIKNLYSCIGNRDSINRSISFNMLQEIFMEWKKP